MNVYVIWFFFFFVFFFQGEDGKRDLVGVGGLRDGYKSKKKARPTIRFCVKCHTVWSFWGGGAQPARSSVSSKIGIHIWNVYIAVCIHNCGSTVALRMRLRNKEDMAAIIDACLVFSKTRG